MYSPLELKIGNVVLWKDYTVVCKAKLMEKFGVSWQKFGIVVRRIPGGGFATYQACVDLELNQACLFILDRKVLGVPFDIIKDKWYELKVTAQKNHIEFYINDEFMGSFDDSSYPSGNIDLGVANAHVHFDDIVITGPDIPDGGPGSISIRQKDKLVAIWGKLKKDY